MASLKFSMKQGDRVRFKEEGEKGMYGTISGEKFNGERWIIKWADGHESSIDKVRAEKFLEILS